MKYIVDLPDAYTSESALLGDILSIPICLEGGKRYGIPTGIKLEPYTEPDSKTVDLQYARDIENVARMNYNEGAKDAWELARKLTHPSNGGLYENEKKEIFDRCNSDSVLIEMSYQEAKEKYEAWRKQKDEIHVGDEIDIDGEITVVTMVNKHGEILSVDCDGMTYYYYVESQLKRAKKTGRHFYEVEDFLKKMRDADD